MVNVQKTNETDEITFILNQHIYLQFCFWNLSLNNYCLRNIFSRSNLNSVEPGKNKFNLGVQQFVPFIICFYFYLLFKKKMSFQHIGNICCLRILFFSFISEFPWILGKDSEGVCRYVLHGLEITVLLFCWLPSKVRESQLTLLFKQKMAENREIHDLPKGICINVKRSRLGWKSNAACFQRW